MAKKGQNVKTGFLGTYSCFPDPMENQGSSTNKGSISAARNSSDAKKGNAGGYDPLVGVGSAKDSVAASAFPKPPAVGQSKIIDGDAQRKGKPVYGDGGGASYKKGGYGKS